MFRHIFCQGQCHGGVGVVAAGVHEAGMAGRIGKIRTFGQGQGVHVGTECNRLFPACIKVGADTAGRRCCNGTVQRVQYRKNVSSCFGKPVFDLGDPVESTAVLNNGREHM